MKVYSTDASGMYHYYYHYYYLQKLPSHPTRDPPHPGPTPHVRASACVRPRACWVFPWVALGTLGVLRFRDVLLD